MRLEILNALANVQDYFTLGLIMFIGINLINVILSTMKSIMTIKSTRLVATLINAISYGFYALIVKSMASYDTTTIVIVTILANLIGVYFSMWLLDKFKKDKLWKVTVIAINDNYWQIKNALLDGGLSFNTYPINTKYGDTTAFDIFAGTQKESLLLKEILKPFKVKYHIVEIGKGL